MEILERERRLCVGVEGVGGGVNKEFNYEINKNKYIKWQCLKIVFGAEMKH